MNENHHENTAQKWKRKPEPKPKRKLKQKLTAYVEKEEQTKDLDSFELLPASIFTRFSFQSIS
jgi:hypothetical protein